MSDSKRPLESKTLLFNLLVAALAVMADQSETLRSVLTPPVYLAVTLAIALINTWLRLQTSQPIKTRRQLAKDGETKQHD